jgi:gliding motility-associated-like protein
LYTWTFGSFGTTNEENPEFTFEEIGKFPIKLLADNGTCQDSMTIFLTFDRLTSFYIPNVFTPNGDGQNDEFDWGVKGIDEFTIVIYNRWGTKVYESEMVDDTWDGGDEPDGTYYYIVRGKEQTLEAEPVEYRGDLTLIRN